MIVGEYNTAQSEVDETVHKIKKLIQHEKFNRRDSPEVLYDIGNNIFVLELINLTQIFSNIILNIFLNITLFNEPL